MQADKTKVTRLLKTAKGQMEGILRMIDEDRYCVDISNQIMATQAILRKVNNEVLHAHIESCVKEAVVSGDTKSTEEKLEEISLIMDKLTK